MTRKQTLAAAAALLIIAAVITWIHQRQKSRLTEAGIVVEPTGVADGSTDESPRPELVIPGKTNLLAQAGTRVKSAVTKLGYRVISEQPVGQSAFILIQKSPESPPIMVDIHAAASEKKDAPVQLEAAIAIPAGAPDAEGDPLRTAVNSAIQTR